MIARRLAQLTHLWRTIMLAALATSSLACVGVNEATRLVR